MAALESHPCRQLCNWRAAPDSDRRTVNTGVLFRCLGCRSEWTADERWTPAQANGQVPAAVIAERRRTDPYWATGEQQ